MYNLNKGGILNLQKYTFYPPEEIAGNVQQIAVQFMIIQRK